MTARTADALASALPAGIHYDAAANLRWDTARVARFQAEKLAEAGYVLVHTAPDEATVERLARALWFETPTPDEFPDGPPPDDYYDAARIALAALTGTSAQAQHTADDATGGGAS